MSGYSDSGSGSYGREIILDLPSVNNIMQICSSDENHNTSSHRSSVIAKRLSERSKNLLLATIAKGFFDSNAIINIRNSATREKSKITVEEFLNTIAERERPSTEEVAGYPTPPRLRAAVLRANRREQLQHVGGNDLDEDGYVILPSPRISITSTSSSGYAVISVADYHSILNESENGVRTMLSGFVKEIQYFTPQFKFLTRRNILFVALGLLLIAILAGAFFVTRTLLNNDNNLHSTSSTPGALATVSGLPNQHRRCHTDADAWPKLWLDIVLLIDNSASQSTLNFYSMLELFKDLWNGSIGGPTVGQDTAKTRVGVVTFDMQAHVLATLDQLNSNTDLINVLNDINQTTSTTVDGSNALLAATSLFGSNAIGDRPNVPNVIIIYAANWGGNNTCQIAESFQETGVILAITTSGQQTTIFPACGYSAGENYTAFDSDLSIKIYESLAFANCFCIGQNLPENSDRRKTDQTAREVWYQFWLPRNDSKYYLRDKWAECILRPVETPHNHDEALRVCYKSRYHLPDEFNLEKHNFLCEIAKSNNILTQWIGLQYDPAILQWFWNDFDHSKNQSSRTWALPSDFTSWSSNQPNMTDNKYCVKSSAVSSGQIGFEWTTAKCSGFNPEDHSQHSCQQPACDALNYCSNA